MKRDRWDIVPTKPVRKYIAIGNISGTAKAPTIGGTFTYAGEYQTFPAQGTAYNQRVGRAIRIKRIYVKFWSNMSATGTLHGHVNWVMFLAKHPNATAFSLANFFDQTSMLLLQNPSTDYSVILFNSIQPLGAGGPTGTPCETADIETDIIQEYGSAATPVTNAICFCWAASGVFATAAPQMWYSGLIEYEDA